MLSLSTVGTASCKAADIMSAFHDINSQAAKSCGAVSILLSMHDIQAKAGLDSSQIGQLQPQHFLPIHGSLRMPGMP